MKTKVGSSETVFMASSASATPSQQTRPNTTICSIFRKTVCLHDWWLIKVAIDPKTTRLGIAGFASRERQAIRAFHSAAIAKRHDAVTVETVDGTTITISGIINRPLTLQNGFSSEVCHHFVSGFPYCWDKYAYQCFDKKFVNITATPPRVSSMHISSNEEAGNLQSISLDNLPVIRIRDFLLSSLEDDRYCEMAESILDDILQKYGNNASKHDRASTQLSTQGRFSEMAVVSVQDGTPSNVNRNMGDWKGQDDTSIRESHPSAMKDSGHNVIYKFHRKTKMKKDTGSIPNSIDAESWTGLNGNSSRRGVTTRSMSSGVDDNGSRRGVTTRSMSRLNNLREKQNGTEISINSPIGRHKRRRP
ncbi:hypothetical protein NMG60_11015001 [Bertholletia excelsa]